MEGTTLVIDLHAASRGPHWLSGKRKPAKPAAKIELHIGKVPTDPEGELTLVLDMYRRLTGKEPTPAEIEKAKAALGRRRGGGRA
jgi:hypothetical protein